MLMEQGAEAAVRWFEKDKWANAPEYVRPRPKYYYFYEWMRERIGEHYPSLPEPVMDKLLATDAGEGGGLLLSFHFITHASTCNPH